MVTELKGVGRSAQSSRERRTNGSFRISTGVMLMPRKWIVSGPSICLLNV